MADVADVAEAAAAAGWVTRFCVSFRMTRLAIVRETSQHGHPTMKRILILAALVTTTILGVSCKSPKGNMPAYGFQTSRPTLVQ